MLSEMQEEIMQEKMHKIALELRCRGIHRVENK